MKQIYEVTGVYPARRPLAIGATVTLTEEAARYFVLDGSLKLIGPAEEPATEEPAAETAPRKGKGR